MRAVVGRVDVGAGRGELRVDPGGEGAEVRLGVETAGDAGLVRDDEDEEPPVVRPLDRLPGALDPGELLGPVHPPAVHVERAVAVEEEGRLPPPRGDGRARGASASGTPMSTKKPS